jgi:adenylate cyclase
VSFERTRSGLLGFLREARRRRVYTALVAYVALSLVLIQLGGALFDAIMLPDWSVRLLTVLLLLGLPVVLVLSWIFDIGPGGVRRTESAEVEDAHVLAPVVTGQAAAAAVRAPRVAARVVRQPTPAPRGAASLASGDDLAAAVAEPEPAPQEPPDPDRVRRAALSLVRHELCTPINAMIGYSEMLLEDVTDEGDPDGAAADLRRIQTAAKELLARVDEILQPERAGIGARDLAEVGAEIRADLRNPVNAVIGYAELLLESGHGDMADELGRIHAAAMRLLELSTDIVQIATSPAGAAPAVLDEPSALAEGVLSKIVPVRPGSPTSDEERQGSLLVIDDNALNRDLLARQLARRGYFVATAETGSAGLERLDAEDFDLVLLDIVMPDLDGIEVLRRIRRRDRLRDVPVIMISSLDEIDSAIRCLELGATDYVTKPFHPTLLDARIGSALELRRTRRHHALLGDGAAGEVARLRRLAAAVCPPAVAERMDESGAVVAYPHATVLWCDLERAVPPALAADPTARIDAMTRTLAALEAAARTHGIETVLLHGPAVLMAGGVPFGAEDDVERVAAAALDVLVAGGDVAPRLAMHTGTAFGALLGAERLSFQLWGEPLELARDLAAHAAAASILVTPATHVLLKDRFAFTSRGVVEIASRGQMRAWRLTGAG